MANRFKIPQNIDVEDKIIGPFTLRQFLYMIGGGILIYFLYLSLGSINMFLFVITAVPTALLVIALVFIKINERPFLDFFLYFIQFVVDPKVRTWEKSTKVRSMMIQGREESEQSKKNVRGNVDKGVVKSRLSELSMIVDTRGWGSAESDEGLRGRVTSSDVVSSAVRSNLKEEEPLEDVFADLEAAMENITEATKKEEKPEDDFSDLALRISELVSKK